MSYRACLGAWILAGGLCCSCPREAHCRGAPAGAAEGARERKPRSDRATRRSEELQQKGAAAKEKGLFTQALQHYQQAYDVKPLPLLQYHIGECHRGMGNAARAAFAYRQYLKYGGEIDNRREVEELAVRMEHLAAETRGNLAPEPEAPEGAPSAAVEKAAGPPEAKK